MIHLAKACARYEPNSWTSINTHQANKRERMRKNEKERNKNIYRVIAICFRDWIKSMFMLAKCLCTLSTFPSNIVEQQSPWARNYHNNNNNIFFYRFFLSYRCVVVVFFSVYFELTIEKKKIFSLYWIESLFSICLIRFDYLLFCFVIKFHIRIRSFVLLAKSKRVDRHCFGESLTNATKNHRQPDKTRKKK